jgi:hypothetical protein
LIKRQADFDTNKQLRQVISSPMIFINKEEENDNSII